MKRTVLISMLFILIPFCAMAMEPNPGCGDSYVDGEVEGESHPIIGGTCPDSHHPVIPGGEAKWKVTCNGTNYATIEGWVKDTSSDDMASAEVTIKCLDGTYNYATSNKKKFKRTCTGTTIKAYLHLRYY